MEMIGLGGQRRRDEATNSEEQGWAGGIGPKAKSDSEFVDSANVVWIF